MGFGHWERKSLHVHSNPTDFEKRALSRSLPQRKRFVEKLLNGLEQLHAILLHHDGMSTFSNLHKTLVRDVRQPGEILIQHVAWQVGVPFGVHQESPSLGIAQD
jgi:hypothetical protein